MLIISVMTHQFYTQNQTNFILYSQHNGHDEYCANNERFDMWDYFLIEPNKTETKHKIKKISSVGNDKCGSQAKWQKKRS